MPLSSTVYMTAIVDVATSLRILVVERHDDTCEMLRFLLEHYGHQVTCVDVAKAAEVALVYLPHVALITLSRDPSALALCLRLRATPEMADSLLIGLTTSDETPMRDVSEALGLDACFLKPVPIDTILTMVSTPRSRIAILGIECASRSLRMMEYS
jgi:DNA-binding response OmpR family regulator